MGLNSALYFDNTSSKTYGVYITGEAVFNAPERAVEMISIPGRNGAFAQDQGRFENIEVTYPAGIYADNESDFADAISDFRNFLCSKKGYCRLEDDYNTGEYREAVYKSGLEVTPALLRAGEFNITFECKPQRFLTSCESATAVANNGKVSNPTLFDAKPLLQIWGSGNFSVGGETLNISGGNIGWYIAKSAFVNPALNNTLTYTFTIDDTYANANDAMRCNKLYLDAYYTPVGCNINDDLSYTYPTTATGDYTWKENSVDNTLTIFTEFNFNGNNFVYGTAKTLTLSNSVSVDTDNYGTITGTMPVSVAYNGTDSFTFTFPSPLSHMAFNHFEFTCGDISINSSQSVLGNPLYFDLDIGEAYKIENGSTVSVNNAVTIPAELPTLPPGDTTFTYDNTITQFKVVPRWWKV